MHYGSTIVSKKTLLLCDYTFFFTILCQRLFLLYGLQAHCLDKFLIYNNNDSLPNNLYAPRCSCFTNDVEVFGRHIFFVNETKATTQIPYKYYQSQFDPKQAEAWFRFPFTVASQQKFQLPKILHFNFPFSYEGNEKEKYH